jgi:hypothetical protein
MSLADRTGHARLGSMRGKAADYPAGYPLSGYTSPTGGRFAIWFSRNAINWGTYNPGFRGAGYYYRYPPLPYYRTTSKQAIRILKNEEKRLKDELKTIQARIDELEKKKTKGGNNSQKAIE